MSFPFLRIRDVLITTIQVELHDSVADSFQEEILATLSRTDARGLIIDISALDMVDSYAARIIAESGRMARLMGVMTIVVGIQPVVAATLVRMGFRLEGLHTAMNVEDGLAMMRRLLRRQRRW